MGRLCRVEPQIATAPWVLPPYMLEEPPRRFSGTCRSWPRCSGRRSCKLSSLCEDKIPCLRDKGRIDPPVCREVQDTRWFRAWTMIFRKTANDVCICREYSSKITNHYSKGLGLRLSCLFFVFKMQHGWSKVYWYLDVLQNVTDVTAMFSLFWS